jgi:hypothetical protein
MKRENLSRTEQMEQLVETMNMLGACDPHSGRDGETVDALFRQWVELRDQPGVAGAQKDSQPG